MARDYAKKRRHSPKKRQAAPGWAWLVAGFCLALLITGLYYLHDYHQQQITFIKAKAKAKAKAKPKSKSASKAQTGKPASQLQFDFYTILPEKSSTTPNVPPSQPQQQPATSPQQFVLQIAAVKSFTAADQLKAELTLLGFNVFVQKYKVGNNTWNRVNVGPYTSRSAAEMDQERLRQSNVNSLLLKK